MKYLKIIALALGGMFLTACNSDSDYNTASGVTVEMGLSDLTASESASTINVPVKITGDANGPVKVTVKVEPTGTNPALPFEERDGVWDGNFIVTSETINIPADGKQANIQIRPIDDKEENENRTFLITIISAEGATIGAQNSTLVTLKDNDSTPYGKMQGQWSFNFTTNTGASSSWSVNLSGYEEGEPDFNTLLTVNGLLGLQTQLDLDYIEDEATGEITVEMQLPEPIGWYNASNYFWVFTGSPSPTGGYYLNGGTVTGTVSADMKTITFDPSVTLLFVVANPELSSILGIYELAENVTMTR